jgi:hypothetical protein
MIEFSEICEFPDKHYMIQLVFIGMTMNNQMKTKIEKNNSNNKKPVNLMPEIEEYGLSFFELGMKYQRALDYERFRFRQKEEEEEK